jgi:cytochrome c oxidase subunit 3
MWMGLASIFMLFAGLVAAYAFALGKQGLYRPVKIPPQLYAGTVMLLSSSVFLQIARHQLRHGRLQAYRKQFYLSFAFGVLFIVCQGLAWVNLAAQDIFVRGNPHGSMWYAFTGFHALHVLGGMIAMVALLIGARKLRADEGEPPLRRHRNAAAVTAMYWHFMALLWLALFGLLQYCNHA